MQGKKHVFRRRKKEEKKTFSHKRYSTQTKANSNSRKLITVASIPRHQQCQGTVSVNMQLVHLSSQVAVSLYTLRSSHFVVDVTGYFKVANGGSSSAGRYVAIDTYRALDTRETHRPGRHSAVRVQPDVPSDAIAVAVAVTSIGLVNFSHTDRRQLHAASSRRHGEASEALVRDARRHRRLVKSHGALLVHLCF